MKSARVTTGAVVGSALNSLKKSSKEKLGTHVKKYYPRLKLE